MSKSSKKRNLFKPPPISAFEYQKDDALFKLLGDDILQCCSCQEYLYYAHNPVVHHRSPNQKIEVELYVPDCGKMICRECAYVYQYTNKQNACLWCKMTKAEHESDSPPFSVWTTLSHMERELMRTANVVCVACKTQMKAEQLDLHKCTAATHDEHKEA